jgi:undecaprenyl diphosphate synthase
VLRWFYDLGIQVVTIWIFSIDNFQRQPDEVAGLFDLIERKTREMTAGSDIRDYQIRVRYIGRTQLLPSGLRQAIAEAEDASRGYDRHFLNVAIAYGGREEIADAFRGYLEAHAGNGTTPADLAREFTADSLDEHLYTAGLPDPDLVIRTSGEYRLSGFLLWQSAYSEYYFCRSYWPEFRRVDLLRALQAYHRRQRRYGR